MRFVVIFVTAPPGGTKVLRRWEREQIARTANRDRRARFNCAHRLRIARSWLLSSCADDAIVVVKRSVSAMAEPMFMNVDEYFLTLETTLPAELRYGVLHVAESPRPRHQSAVASLFLALN